MELDKATCEELIKRLIAYSQCTAQENKKGIEVSCLVIQVLADTKVEIPRLD